MSQSERSNVERRQEFLKVVESLVCKDRNVTHGDAEDNFKVIASLWSRYLNGPVDSKDVAAMMCLFKISRLINNIDNLENWHDLAGYAACGGGIVMKKAESE
jgi:hypothetical protein